MEKVLQSGHHFKVVTIEHDAYRFGNRYRNREREILQAAGYVMICSDVGAIVLKQVEDCWIHPSYFQERDVQWLQDHAKILSGKPYWRMIRFLCKNIPY